MFERYNEHARRVIFCARLAASQSNSSALDSAHLLLGLLREARSLLTRVLTAAAIEDLSDKVPFKVVCTNPSLRIQMPLSSECRRILNHAAEEATDLDHRYIGAEHLLLGILRESDCLASRLLYESNVRLDETRRQFVSGFSEEDDTTTGNVSRDIVHSLIDKLPEGMLVPLKDVIDRMLSRADQTARESSVKVLQMGQSNAGSRKTKESAARTSGAGAE